MLRFCSFFSHVQTHLKFTAPSTARRGQSNWGFQGSIRWCGAWPDAQQDQVRPPRIPGLSPFVVKTGFAQVEVDEGRRGLQKHRDGLAKNETWPFATIRQSIWTKRWWYENQDGHPVSTKIDQEREDKSDDWRACATLAEMIQCSSFQKIYLNSQNDCDNASIEDPSTEALSWSNTLMFNANMLSTCSATNSLKPFT